MFALQDEMRQEIAQALKLEPLTAELEQMNVRRQPIWKRMTISSVRSRRRRAPVPQEGCARRSTSTTGPRRSTPASRKSLRPMHGQPAFIWRMTYDDVLQSALARNRAYDAAGRALQLNPGLALPYATLAILQSVDRRFDESIVSAQKAVALGPGNADAYITLGYVHMFAGTFPEAAAAIETALKLDPKLSPVNRQIAGEVFFFSGDNDRAIEILELAREEHRNWMAC